MLNFDLNYAYYSKNSLTQIYVRKALERNKGWKGDNDVEPQQDDLLEIFELPWTAVQNCIQIDQGILKFKVAQEGGIIKFNKIILGCFRALVWIRLLGLKKKLEN